MAETSQPPLPSRPGRPVPGEPGPGAVRRPGPGLLAFAAVVLGSALLGLLAGFAWMHLAPRPLYVVVSGGAEAANPEDSAFIAADGWFCAVSVAGGIVTGLLGYLLAVRRHGALPMAGILAGGLAAAYAAMWIGQRSGTAAFFQRLAASKPGTLLRAPIKLEAHGALAFWPLAAGLVAGGIEALVLLRERRRAQAQQRAFSGAHAHAAAAPPGGPWREPSGGPWPEPSGPWREPPGGPWPEPPRGAAQDAEPG